MSIQFSTLFMSIILCCTIPVNQLSIFQLYPVLSSPILNSSIPLSASLILLLFFQLFYQLSFYFHNYTKYTNCQIPNFYLACFSAFPFEIFILPFVSEFPYCLSSVDVPVKLYSNIPVPISFAANQASFSTQLYSSQNSNP